MGESGVLYTVLYNNNFDSNNSSLTKVALLFWSAHEQIDYLVRCLCLCSYSHQPPANVGNSQGAR